MNQENIEVDDRSMSILTDVQSCARNFANELVYCKLAALHCSRATTSIQPVRLCYTGRVPRCQQAYSFVPSMLNCLVSLMRVRAAYEHPNSQNHAFPPLQRQDPFTLTQPPAMPILVAAVSKIARQNTAQQTALLAGSGGGALSVFRWHPINGSRFLDEPQKDDGHPYANLVTTDIFLCCEPIVIVPDM